MAGQRPVAAAGASRVCRANPHGDSHDVCSVIYHYADGLVHNHFGQALANNKGSVLLATFHVQLANAQINYFGKSFVRGGPKHYGSGPVAADTGEIALHRPNRFAEVWREIAGEG